MKLLGGMGKPLQNSEMSRSFAYSTWKIFPFATLIVFSYINSMVDGVFLGEGWGGNCG